MTIPSHTLTQLVKMALTMLTIIGAAVIARVRYKYLPPNLRALAWLAWFELPLELVGIGLAFMQRNNLFLMPIYTVGELGLLALVYRYTLQSPGFHKAMPWLVGGFAAYTLLDTLADPDLTWYKPGQQVLQGLLILGMAGLYFRQQLQELQVQPLEREPMFWVSVGLALYFLGYLHIALFSNYMLKHYSMEFNRNVWTIHFVLTLVLHSCYCWALWLRQQQGAGLAKQADVEPASRQQDHSFSE
jgi:hypothetical protein